MGKRIHPLALAAAECFLCGDQPQGRRFYRRLGSCVSARELKRQMSAAKAEVRLRIKQQAAMEAATTS